MKKIILEIVQNLEANYAGRKLKLCLGNSLRLCILLMNSDFYFLQCPTAGKFCIYDDLAKFISQVVQIHLAITF